MNHSNSTTGYRSSRPTLCRYYNTNGYCFYGDQCQFVHARPSSNEGRMGTYNLQTTVEGYSFLMFAYFIGDFNVDRYIFSYLARLEDGIVKYLWQILQAQF